MAWCYKGKHELPEEAFNKSELARTCGMICRECAKKAKRDRWHRIQKEKEKEEVFNNMFFNFKGL